MEVQSFAINPSERQYSKDAIADIVVKANVVSMTPEDHKDESKYVETSCGCRSQAVEPKNMASQTRNMLTMRWY